MKRQSPSNKHVNIGLVGYQFMGKAHSNAWLQVPHFFSPTLTPVMHTLCGRNAAAVEAVARRWGWQHTRSNYRNMLADGEISLVDVAVPNDAHAEIVLAAVAAGKAIACEKPLARTLAEAKAMLAAVRKARVRNYVWFNYRRVPALWLARDMIGKGRIGRVFHVRAQYLQDWIKNPNVPLVWRLSGKVAGSGSLGDLAAHSIDMARFLLGEEFAEVCGLSHTFIKSRPIGEMVEGLTARAAARASGRGPKRKRMGRVTVDDAVLFMARFSGGGIGSFEATRFATGHHNANNIEINGEHGAIRFHFEDFSYLDYFDDTLPPAEKGWRRISVTAGHDPYSGQYWPAGHVIGYEHTFINTAFDILEDLAGPKQRFHADFEDGLRCQQVLEAVERSARERQWLRPAEM